MWPFGNDTDWVKGELLRRAGRGAARLGKAQAGLDKARFMARQGSGLAWRGRARQGKVQGAAWRGRAW